jgi:hypothetical protein
MDYRRNSVLSETFRDVIMVSWVVTPCSHVGGYQHFGETHRLHLPGKTRCHNPEDPNPHFHSHENLKFDPTCRLFLQFTST